jgi:hypothetical protein
MASIASIFSNSTSGTISPTGSLIAYDPGTVTTTVVPASGSLFSISSNTITYNGTNIQNAIVVYNISYTSSVTSGNLGFYVYKNGTTALPISYSHRTNNSTDIIDTHAFFITQLNNGDTFQIVCQDESGVNPTITSDTFRFGMIS